MITTTAAITTSSKTSPAINDPTRSATFKLALPGLASVVCGLLVRLGNVGGLGLVEAQESEGDNRSGVLVICVVMVVVINLCSDRQS